MAYFYRRNAKTVINSRWSINGTRIASLGKSIIEIEIDEIVTEIEVEVINSQDKMLIIGNDFMKNWRANINFETHTLTLNDQGYEIYIPVEYIKSNKVRFETPSQDEYVEEEEDPNYEEDEESAPVLSQASSSMIKEQN